MPQFQPSLSRQAWWLLLISAVFTLSIGLSNTFVNIYLWKIDRSYTSIGWYNFALYCLIPITFVGAGYVAKRYHPVWTLRIGVMMHGLFYALMLTIGDHLAARPVVPGAILGIASGFYWLSFNVISMRKTQRGGRDRFYGMNGAAGAIAGMVAPPVAGFLIAQEDRFGGLSGYHLIFGLSLALFAVATWISFQLHSQTLGQTLHLAVAVQAVWRQADWRATLLACAVYGMREGVFLFLIGLLFYVVAGSEWRLGEFLFLQSGLSSLAFFAVGRLARPANRLRLLGLGAVGMALSAFLFLLPIRTGTLLTYGASIAVFLPFFLITLQGTVYDRIGELDDAGQNHTEHIIAREVCENAGRVVGVAAFLAVAYVRPSRASFAFLALGLGLVQLISWHQLRRAADSQQAASLLTRDEKRGQASARPSNRARV